MCSERLTTPRRFLTATPYTLFAFHRFGRHLLFHVDWGGNGESPIAVGWVDLLTGHEADVTPEVDGLDETVAGADGGIAIRSGRDIYYAPRPRPRAGRAAPAGDRRRQARRAVAGGARRAGVLADR